MPINDTIDYYLPRIAGIWDYYPFGMQMPSRVMASGAYRYGFNGKEMDDEISGSGNQYDYGFRIYNPRLGKFLSVDPLAKVYPMLTSYQFASNTPIQAVDLDGLERYYAADGNYLGQIGSLNQIKVVNDKSLWDSYNKSIDQSNSSLEYDRIQYNREQKAIYNLNAGSTTLSNETSKVQSHVLTTINESVARSYELFGNKVFIKGEGANLKDENGTDVASFGSGGNAQSFFNIKTGQGAVTVNNVWDDYYLMIMMLEHEKNHNEEVKIFGKHGISTQPNHHFDVQWEAHLMYGRKSQDAFNYSKEILNDYLDEMATELNKIKDKSSSKYRRKYKDYSERKEKYNHEFTPE